MKFNSSFKDSRWVVSKSTDFGLTFLQDIKASNWFGSEEVCDCCPGVLISEKRIVCCYIEIIIKIFATVGCQFLTIVGKLFQTHVM